MWLNLGSQLGTPWYAAEAMHWQMGETDMMRRAGGVSFPKVKSTTANVGANGESEAHEGRSDLLSLQDELQAAQSQIETLKIARSFYMEERNFIREYLVEHAPHMAGVLQGRPTSPPTIQCLRIDSPIPVSPSTKNKALHMIEREEVMDWT